MSFKLDKENFPFVACNCCNRKIFRSSVNFNSDQTGLKKEEEGILTRMETADER